MRHITFNSGQNDSAPRAVKVENLKKKKKISSVLAVTVSCYMSQLIQKTGPFFVKGLHRDPHWSAFRNRVDELLGGAFVSG